MSHQISAGCALARVKSEIIELLDAELEELWAWLPQTFVLKRRRVQDILAAPIEQLGNRTKCASGEAFVEEMDPNVEMETESHGEDEHAEHDICAKQPELGGRLGSDLRAADQSDHTQDSDWATEATSRHISDEQAKCHWNNLKDTEEANVMFGEDKDGGVRINMTVETVKISKDTDDSVLQKESDVQGNPRLDQGAGPAANDKGSLTSVPWRSQPQPLAAPPNGERTVAPPPPPKEVVEEIDHGRLCNSCEEAEGHDDLKEDAKEGQAMSHTTEGSIEASTEAETLSVIDSDAQMAAILAQEESAEWPALERKHVEWPKPDSKPRSLAAAPKSALHQKSSVSAKAVRSDTAAVATKVSRPGDRRTSEEIKPSPEEMLNRLVGTWCDSAGRNPSTYTLSLDRDGKSLSLLTVRSDKHEQFTKALIRIGPRPDKTIGVLWGAKPSFVLADDLSKLDGNSSLCWICWKSGSGGRDYNWTRVIDA